MTCFLRIPAGISRRVLRRCPEYPEHLQKLTIIIRCKTCRMRSDNSLSSAQDHADPPVVLRMCFRRQPLSLLLNAWRLRTALADSACRRARKRSLCGSARHLSEAHGGKFVGRCGTTMIRCAHEHVCARVRARRALGRGAGGKFEKAGQNPLTGGKCGDSIKTT